MFKTVGIEGLKEAAIKKCGFTEDEWTVEFLNYKLNKQRDKPLCC